MQRFANQSFDLETDWPETFFHGKHLSEQQRRVLNWY
jgi:hypothetical protein